MRLYGQKKKRLRDLENLTSYVKMFFMHGNSFRHGFAMPPPSGGRLKVVCSQRTVAEGFRLFQGGRFKAVRHRPYGVCTRTPVPTLKQSKHAECERSFVHFRAVVGASPYRMFFVPSTRRLYGEMSSFSRRGDLWSPVCGIFVF